MEFRKINIDKLLKIFDKKNSRSAAPKSLFVEFFDQSIGKQSKLSSSNNYIEIKPMSVIFFGKRKSVLQCTQFPICLSWASTIHKVQGLTLDSVAVDIGSKVFSSGMSYVALSRVTKFKGLHLLDFHPNSLKVSPDVKAEMERLQAILV